MKIRFLLFVAIIFITTACSQHHCPTYQNSGIKYHHHAPNHAHH